MDIAIDQIKFKGSRFIFHLLFWIIYLLFFIFQSVLYKEDPDMVKIIASLAITMWVDIGAAYFTVYCLFPKFLYKKEYITFMMLFLASAAAAIIFQRLITYYITHPLLFPDSGKSLGFWMINPFYTFVNIYTVVGLFAAIKLLKNWFKTQQLKAELENKNKTSELALLRSQINPHFLFNTLNNIDSLINRDREKASDAIIKLSDIMRYMLYDANEEMVPLEKEINYMKSYISLQKLRLKHPDFIQFKLGGDCPGRAIAPMLLIPFVENAFKHGRKNVDPPGIIINLVCSGDHIKFEVKNYVHEFEQQEKDDTPGIGLVNTRKRLEILYPGKHELLINQSGNTFQADLTLYS